MTMERTDEDAGAPRPVAPDAAVASSSPPSPHPVEDRALALEEKLQRFTETMARLQADFENYRKRAKRERDEAATDAQVALVRVLVDVRDDIEKASAVDGAHRAVVEGLGLIVRRLEAELARLGVVRLAPGPGDIFEADLHEGLLAVETTEHPPGTVVETLSPGYSLAGRLVRPARVTVAAAPAAG